jgi:hypothetical protein
MYMVNAAQGRKTKNLMAGKKNQLKQDINLQMNRRMPPKAESLFKLFELILLLPLVVRVDALCSLPHLLHHPAHIGDQGRRMQGRK